MYANVWNSMDLSMLYGFLDTFFVSNFQQETKFNQVQGTTFSPTALHGAVSVAKFWYTQMSFSPDTTVTLKDVRIIEGDDKSQNRVIARVVMQGTRIYDVPESFARSLRSTPLTQEECDLCNTQSNNTIGLKRTLNDLTTNTTSRPPIVDSLLKSRHDLVKTFPLLATPYQTQVEGLFTMYTNENNQVTRFLVEMPHPRPAV
jgi:hypothetical protein